MGVLLLMADPNDTRDTGPRAGSPLWSYLATVIAAGFTVLAVTQWLIDQEELAGLARSPLFWMLSILVVLGELRPVVLSSSMTVGGTYPSTMFTFAALLHYGLPVAVLLQSVAMIVNGAVTRKAYHRVMFNIAQATLACTAAGVVLGLFGDDRPFAVTPGVPEGSDLLAIGLAGLGYFVLRALLVSGAVALHE